MSELSKALLDFCKAPAPGAIGMLSETEIADNTLLENTNLEFMWILYAAGFYEFENNGGEMTLLGFNSRDFETFQRTVNVFEHRAVQRSILSLRSNSL